MIEINVYEEDLNVTESLLHSAEYFLSTRITHFLIGKSGDRKAIAEYDDMKLVVKGIGVEENAGEISVGGATLSVDEHGTESKITVMRSWEEDILHDDFMAKYILKSFVQNYVPVRVDPGQRILLPFGPEARDLEGIPLSSDAHSNKHIQIN
jgi:hypothetical protein